MFTIRPQEVYRWKLFRQSDRRDLDCIFSHIITGLCISRISPLLFKLFTKGLPCWMHPNALKLVHINLCISYHYRPLSQTVYCRPGDVYRPNSLRSTALPPACWPAELEIVTRYGAAVLVVAEYIGIPARIFRNFSLGRRLRSQLIRKCMWYFVMSCLGTRVTSLNTLSFLAVHMTWMAVETTTARYCQVLIALYVNWLSRRIWDILDLAQLSGQGRDVGSLCKPCGRVVALQQTMINCLDLLHAHTHRLCTRWWKRKLG